MLPINNLPETCLLKTFDFLPIKDLLMINTVCRHWSKLYKSACCQRKLLQLKTINGIKSRNALQLSVLNETITKKIITLFPALDTLNIELQLNCALEIKQLYNFYSAKLISTHLTLQPVYRTKQCDQRQGLIDVLEAINGCVKLRSLTLHLSAPKFINIKQKFAFNLLILSRLKYFQFMSSGFESVSEGDVNMPLDILEQFALSNEHLVVEICNQVTLKKAMTLDKKIARCIAAASLKDTITIDNLFNLSSFSVVFTSIEKLTLEVDPNVSGELLGNCLKQMNCLRLLNLTTLLTFSDLHKYLPNVTINHQNYSDYKVIFPVEHL